MTVARTIEANLDMDTLFAFARRAEAASMTITVDKVSDLWRYDARFLAVLAIPVVAMVAVLGVDGDLATLRTW